MSHRGGQSSVAQAKRDAAAFVNAVRASDNVGYVQSLAVPSIVNDRDVVLAALSVAVRLRHDRVAEYLLKLPVFYPPSLEARDAFIAAAGSSDDIAHVKRFATPDVIGNHEAVLDAAAAAARSRNHTVLAYILRLPIMRRPPPKTTTSSALAAATSALAAAAVAAAPPDSHRRGRTMTRAGRTVWRRPSRSRSRDGLPTCAALRRQLHAADRVALVGAIRRHQRERASKVALDTMTMAALVTFASKAAMLDALGYADLDALGYADCREGGGAAGADAYDEM